MSLKRAWFMSIVAMTITRGNQANPTPNGTYQFSRNQWCPNVSESFQVACRSGITNYHLPINRPCTPTTRMMVVAHNWRSRWYCMSSATKFLSAASSRISRFFFLDRSMAHQQWQGSRSYYPAWSDQYNNQQQPYQYSHSQQDQYDPSYPYYYPPQQQHAQEQYPYTPTTSQPPPHASVIHRLHEQTQQQQALGALAAASITTALQGGQSNNTMWYSHQQPAQAYTQQQQQQHHHHYPPQRAMVAYNDLEPSPAPSPPRPQGYVYQMKGCCTCRESHQSRIMQVVLL